MSTRVFGAAAAVVALLAAGCNSGGGLGFPDFLGAQVAVSDAGGGRAKDLRICCDGDTVYAVWSDDRNDPLGDEDIFFNVSTDAGRTWLPADIRLDTDAPGAADSGDPRICCDGTRVYVAWIDDRSGRDAVRFNASSDGGATWLAFDLQLDSASTGDARDPAICCDGTRVYVAWSDDRSGARDIRANVSSTGGATWRGSDLRLDTDAAGAADSDRPSVCCEGTVVYVAWEDDRDGSIRMNRSTDGGTNWFASDVRMDTAAAGAASNVTVCCRGLTAYAAWEDRRDGERDIRFNRSSDGGITWGTADTRLDTDAAGAATSRDLQFTCSEFRLYAVWTDERDGALARHIRLNSSTDGGFTWQAADVRVDAAALDAHDPALASSGFDVFVIWAEDREGTGFDDLYLNFSTDSGVTWSATDTRINTDPPGTIAAGAPELCADENFEVYAAWLPTASPTPVLNPSG